MTKIKATVKLFLPGTTEPRFTGVLRISASKNIDFDIEDMKLLWDVERAINNHVAGRCHIELEEVYS